MALKAIVETIESVPEAARGFYKENEGKFILEVEPVDGFGLEDVSGLKNTLGKEMTLRKRLEKDVLKFKDIDPDKARDALARLEELGNIDPTKEADKIVSERLEAAKRQLLEKHGEEIKTRDGRIGQLTKTVEGLLIDQSATAALAESKGSVELLLPHVQKHTRVREDNGRFVVEVVDKDGNARIGNAKGDPMTIADLVQEMRQSDAFGRAFEGSGQSGSGTQPTKQPGNPDQKPGVPKTWAEAKTPEDKAAFLKSQKKE
ncbi:hypothetical protein [Bradyrhizobium sp. URHD0069]|uniref:hypothetical protein n=1 Tax=Bradyrhizobium sp. URHD0069 TaxID=1380355 RepID=UPI000495192D|nr:hypothetical protein [Bradyrhizobium sp. URHD0069]